MTAKGNCRVCGRRLQEYLAINAFLLLLDRDNKNLRDDVRVRAAEELMERGRMKDG